jgi:hypothetical protein
LHNSKYIFQDRTLELTAQLQQQQRVVAVAGLMSSKPTNVSASTGYGIWPTNYHHHQQSMATSFAAAVANFENPFLGAGQSQDHQHQTSTII